jgi:NTE family protein
MITLGFNDLEDEAERKHLNRLPTSFALRPEDVDRLREAGRKLLRESPAFQALLADLHQRDARYRTRAIDRIGERPWIGSVGS